MRQVGYVMQFTGAARPKRGKKNEMVAKSGSATGSITTSVGARGPRASVKSGPREKAAFKSEVKVLKDGTFTEAGTIEFGKAGKLRFSTRGVGEMGPSAIEGITHGAIMWNVDGGTGVFRGASGIITSNFTLNEDGEVTDNQWGVLYVK